MAIFPRVKEAREALKAKALEIFEFQMRIAKEALEARDFEEANKAIQFLIEHMPKDDDGVTMIDTSVDQKKVSEGPKGPAIQIGIALAPQKPKELPSVSVIDVTDD